jgi:hypothetical protein
LTVLKRSAAQGSKGGSVGLNVMAFWRSIQTPEKSRGRSAEVDVKPPQTETPVARKHAANANAAIRKKLEEIRGSRRPARRHAFNFPVPSLPRNIHVWRLSWFEATQVITRPGKLRDSRDSEAISHRVRNNRS